MDKDSLIKNYLEEKRSVSFIARKYSVSENKVNYWLGKYKIKKRSIATALYLKNNPKGDPFHFKKLKTNKDWLLYGVGIGLFWGEGNKRDSHSIRLGNTDPKMIKVYIKFLEDIFNIDRNKLKFGLQIFSDTKSSVAKHFWVDKLKVKPEQFQKVVVTPTRGDGTYKSKSKYGVLTVYFNNVKLKKIFDDLIENPLIM